MQSGFPSPSLQRNECKRVYLSSPYDSWLTRSRPAVDILVITYVILAAKAAYGRVCRHV